MKDQFIQIRVSEKLKERYMKALKYESEETGLTINATMNLTQAIFNYVTGIEEKKEKKEKKAAALSK